ncbi:MAG: transcriptional regulator MntR [Thermoplasmatota archaeon]
MDRGDGRLEELRQAHAPSAASRKTREKAASPRVEDYLEVILELIQTKGYARMVEIAAHLHVATPSVTKMIQRLDEDGLVVYERYRGVILTSRGMTVAKAVRERHGVVAEFLELLGMDAASSHRMTEGMEHYLDAPTLRRLDDLVSHIREHPEWWREFSRTRSSRRRNS